MHNLLRRKPTTNNYTVESGRIAWLRRCLATLTATVAISAAVFGMIAGAGLDGMATTASATTAPSATMLTTSSPPTDGGMVGYVGCSNSEMAVGGYHHTYGPGHLWPQILGYSGGSIDQWAQPGGRWTYFDYGQSHKPATVVWWHICVHPGGTFDQATQVLAQLRSRIGLSVPIYASPLATYSAPGQCAMADTATSAAIVNRLIAEGSVRRGPVLTQLTPQTTLADGCHPLASVQILDGQILHAFFDLQQPQPSPPPTDGGVVGYVGCSNSEMAVGGYHHTYGTGHFWPQILEYSGGSIDRWAQPGGRWTNFDYAESQKPATVVWWHVCVHPGGTFEQATQVLTQLRSRIGSSVPIYASPLATYSAPGECAMADTAASAAIVNRLVAEGSVRRGPILTQLTPQTTMADGCHPLASVQVLDGQILHAFFDLRQPQTSP